VRLDEGRAPVLKADEQQQRRAREAALRAQPAPAKPPQAVR
jgi:hypothetical protein